MKIDTFTFPVNNNNTFICGDKKISGKQWAHECLLLASEINNYTEKNWLLYQDDFYQYSLYFFALLLANKNIVLAQSEQYERFKQAATFADISIGCLNVDNEQNKSLLPHFSPNKKTEQDFDRIYGQANSEISASENSQTNEHGTDKILSSDLVFNLNLSLNPNTSITLFTSGSTGEAKAIKKYWYQLANEINSLQGLFPHDGEQPCVLTTVTHKHIYGLLFKLLWPVFTDSVIICDTIEYPEQVEHYGDKFKNIVMVSSPSYLTRASQQFSTNVITKIQRIFCSGGALNNKVSTEFFNRYQRLITEIYGSTETGGIAWREQAKDSLWQLFPEHQATLAKDNTLLLTSPFLVKNETFKTDDRVELNGRFFNLLGRVDRIIKLHEKRLSLDEIEKELNSLPQISDSHCFMLEAAQTKKALVAVVVLKNNDVALDKEQKKQLVKACKVALAPVFEASLLPRKWRFVQQLPFNTQGKLVKEQLVNLFIE